MLWCSRRDSWNLAMFDTPEYASYINVCQELQLERKFEDGDWESAGGDPPVVYCALCAREYGEDLNPPQAGHGLFWLPRLDQWLAMLEEAGHEWNLIRDALMPDTTDRPRYLAGAEDVPEVRAAPTPEEAAARLWMAVTGPPSSCPSPDSDGLTQSDAS